jgi:phosphoribosyl 1,2-cyclic phosphodiesterase
MRLKVLGSGSSGNCYFLIANNGDVLIIEAGIRIVELKKKLNFDISKICGCLVSHFHQDHAKYLPDYAYAGIKCYSNKETFSALKVSHNYIIIKPKTETAIGSFTVVAFELVHDTECYGYLINHPESGLICFITDTHYCHYTFSKINFYMIESNYSQEIMDQNILSGRLPSVVRKRTGESHMSIETCKKTLMANDLSETKNIILIHLSEGNSNAVDFIKQVQDLTGIQTMVAEKGMEIELNKSSF